MKTQLIKSWKQVIAAVLGMVAASATFSAFAEAVTDMNDVTAVVAGWKNAKEALGEQLEAEPVSVQAYSGLGGTGTYYVVSLEGGGYVVTSGDTSLEPVLAYSKTGTWVDDVTRNPLMAMLQIDVAAATMAELSSANATGASSAKSGGRRLTATTEGTTASTQQQEANATKWAKYKAAASQKGGKRLQASQPSSDLRVSTLVQSNWSQDGHGENYYTPPYDPGSSYNYVCGCVATMMAQIMRYWQWPQGTNITAIADYSGYVKYKNNTTNFEWTVSDGYRKATRKYSTSSANDTVASSLTAWSPAFGGTYDWANMPLNNQVSNLSTARKQAIGKLTRDCGIACRMTYGDGGSGAPMLCAQRFVDQFAYANAKAATGGWTDANRDALLSNLDAGLPCGVEVPGHAIVADGYGYNNSGTLFVHFNMGWGSIGNDTWYTPPSSIGSFTAVNTILYNIYPPSTGAPERTVVSGRVLRNSTVQSGVTVTATNRETGFTTNVTSNAKGIYYFLLPHGYYTFSATSGGYSAKVERKVDVCTSSIIYSAGMGGYGIFGSSAPANIHGLNLNLGTAITAPSVALAHRWSFTGNLNDSVGSSTAAKIGSKVEVVDGKAVCTGDGAGQGSLNLGTNLLNTDGATIEIWAANDEVKGGSRIFEYGTDTGHYFMMAWTKSTDLYVDCVEAFSGANNIYDGTLSPYVLGKQYHISVTFERQNDGTTAVRAMKRDAGSGALLRASVYSVTNGLHTFTSPVLRLGRSFQGNADARATYDEVRVWNGVLTDAQLKASVAAGPDANLTTLPWSGAAPRYVAKAVWQGGATAPTASSLVNSANWSCTDQDGAAITGVPEARTLVIIPNGTTAFTIPEGYTPAWRKVRIGSEGAANTQFAKKSAVSGYAAQLEATQAAYTGRRDGSPGELARDIALSIDNAPASLAGSQVLYDGWINVSAAQAGRWTFFAYADDYASVNIDGEWIAYSGSMSDALRTTSADISAGWHRFRIVVGDTGGGYGGYVLTGNFRYLTPVAVSVNGGPLLAFSSSNFTFGAPAGGASAVTLAGDCDLSAVDEVVLDTGAALDLKGHTLTVNAISGSYLGAAIENSSATDATLEYRVSLTESGAAGNVEIASNVTAQRLVRTYTWVGGSSGNLSVASNWSPAHDGVFTSDDELVVGTAANITVDVPATVARVRFNTADSTRFAAAAGGAKLTVGEIVNDGAGTATFECPVQFSGMYHVEQTGAVKFPGGATATYPDPALRTASSSDLARTLDGVFTFTADWNVPNLGDGNHPWIIPNGSEVYGQVFTGSESGNNRILYIANGGYARFTTVAIGNSCGEIGIDGFLEATTEVTVGSKGGSGSLGSGGTTGTIKAPCIRKVGGYYVYMYIPNLIVGAGGFGADYKDYDLRFYNDLNITASANFDFIGVYNSNNPKDWNLNLNGKTLTINVPEGLTVTFGVTATASGVVRKKGAGTLVMTDTDKKGVSGYVKDYTGGTHIEEGTVRVAASNQIGTGDVTIYPGARLELAAGVTLDNVVKTSATGVGSLYMENGSSVALSAATPCSLASFELAAGARATVTTTSSADAGAVLLSGAVGDYASRLTVPSGFSFSAGCVMVPVAAAAATDYVWVGASGGSWSAASNWRVNGATPASAPGSGDTIRFENTAAVTVGGSGTLTVTKIVTTTGAPVTFNIPVAFAATYLVENAVVPPVFAAGATATYPDASLTSMNAASHVLPDGLAFTQDWTIPLQPANNPFVVPVGASITGKVLSAAEYSATQPDLRIDAGAVATFDSVSVNRRFVVWLNGGRLVATGDVLFNGTSGGSDFGYYAQPNVGTVEAHGVYKSASGGGSITCYVTNFVVGAGGFGMLRRDYMWGFQKDTRLTATADLTIHEPHTDGGALDGQSDTDWGFNFNGHTFTVDTAGHTVTFDSYVRESASKIIKEGAGEMIMRSRQKKHSGGTDVTAGKLTVAVANGAGYGTTTVRSGATLAFTSAATSQAYPIVVQSGATLEWAAAVSDTSTLTLEGGAILKPGAGGAFTASTLSLAGGSGPVVIDLSGLNIIPDVTIPILGGVASGEETFFSVILPEGVEGELAVNASGVLCFSSRGARLTHRWTFNNDYSDSIGSADATIAANGNVSLSNGKAILAGGGGAGYLNLGAGVLGRGDVATLELWATNITEAANWAYLFTYGKHDSSPNDLFTLCNRSSGLSYSRTTRNGMLEGYVNGTQFIRQNEILIGMPEGMAYHYSVTFTVNGANTDTRWMVRDAATGFLLAEHSVTIPSLTLAGAADAGWMLTLGHNPFANSTLDLNAGFDEVRVWNGVLSDEQLMANAIVGPDEPLGSSAGYVNIAAGATFAVPTVGGYGYKTDLPVLVGAGAKIRFDTTGYLGKGLRFKTGGITVPSGSVLDYVELSDSANYAATMEDANTILVQLKSTIPYESTWTGGAPSSAADLTTAANWTSVNAQGATITAAPTAKTTVILSAAALATFTLPADFTPNWGRVVFGGRTATQSGRIAGTPNMNKLAYLYRDIADYTSLGANGVESINGNGSGVAFLKNYLVQSQVRFDGWVNVPADKAGRWFINCQFDDAVTLFIDGERVFHDPCWHPAVVGGCFVSEGWHRFTLIAADGGGGYGCHANDTVNGTRVPFRITVNGSLTAFYLFTFGTDSDTVTLSGDADWRALGPIVLGSGLTIDLNGHNLSVAEIDSEVLGAVIKNTSGTASTLYTYSGTVGSGVVTDNITVGRFPVATATWTGAAGDNDVTTPGNWNCYDSSSNLLPGALPMTATTVTISDEPEAIASSGAALAWKWLDLGTVANKTGTLTFNSGSTFSLPLTSNRALQMGTVANSTGILNVNGGNVTIGCLNAPSAANNAKVTVNVTGGTLTISGWTDFGRNSSANATFNQSGGTVNAGGNLWIGRSNSGTATYNLSNATLNQTGGTLDLGESSGCKGIFNMSGNSTLTSTVNYSLGRNGVGEMTISGGTTSLRNVYVGHQNSARGTITQTGGTFTLGNSNTSMFIGQAQNAAGLYLQTHGTLNTANANANLYVGDNGRGVLDAAGTVTVTKAGYGVVVGSQATGRGELRLRDGGSLTTSYIKKNNASAAAGAAFGAGTLTTKQANTTFINGMNGLVFDPGTFTLNAAHNVTISGNAETFASAGARIAKIGAGTVTIDRLPPVDDFAVNAGTVALSADNASARAAVNAASGNVYPASPSAALLANNYLLHRWNFNGHALDLVGTNHAAIVSTASVSYNSAADIQIPGGNRGTGWIDCGSNIIPAELGDTPFTIEFWAKPKSNVSWAQWFAFGNSSDANGTGGGLTGLIIAPKSGAGNYPSFRMVGAKTSNNVAIGSGVLTLDKEYHVAVVVKPTGSNTATVTAYIEDPSGGEAIRVQSENVTNWSTTTIVQKNFWLGHSHWNDNDVFSTYNEVRVWAVALSQAQIEANGTLGPNVLPVLSATSTLGVTESITVASGATLDLGGHTLTQPVVAGAGTVQNGTLNVGTLVPGGDGTTGAIALNVSSVSGVIRIDDGDTFTTTTAGLDLSGATIDLAFTPTANYIVATASGSGSFTGLPAFTVNGAPLKGWKVKLSADGKTLRIIRIRGMMLMAW